MPKRATLRLPLLAAATLAVFGCSSSEAGPAAEEPAAVTSLACPSPGALPFTLPSSGFQAPDNEQLAAENPRNKDEASDAIGNPDGEHANVYLADGATPAAGGIDYHGRKARTGATNGLFATALAGEWVSLWTYGGGAGWTMLGRAMTDGKGFYDLPDTGFVGAPGQPIYAVLEADGSCAAHYDYSLPSGTRVVVFDIDGTLTTSDGEVMAQLTQASYTPAMMTAADALVRAWAKLGYTVVYLTARPHVYREESRSWLDEEGFPQGALITTNGGVLSDAAAFKTLWLERMTHEFGWKIAAAYGNADTDIEAYDNVGIPKDHTFIIGPLAGTEGTVAIENDDYTSHIAEFVEGQPGAD